MRPASVALRCWRSGLILPRNSLKFFAMPRLLFLARSLIGSVELFEVLIIETIGQRDHAFVELGLARLATADQQDRHPSRIKCVKNSVRVPARLYSQLPHVSVP